MNRNENDARYLSINTKLQDLSATNNISLNNYRITNLADPISNSDAVSLSILNTGLSSKMDISERSEFIRTNGLSTIL